MLVEAEVGEQLLDLLILGRIAIFETFEGALGFEIEFDAGRICNLHGANIILDAIFLLNTEVAEDGQLGVLWAK